MRQTLLVQLREDAEAPCEWQLQAPGATTPLQTGRAALPELLDERGAGVRIVALVPGEQVLLTGVDLPIRQAGKLLQAAPYALEDQLAEDVETLHFAAGTRQPDGHTPIAVVAHADMQDWLERFGEHRPQVELLLPDMLALDPQQPSLYVDPDGRCLMRSGDAAGFTSGLELLPLTWPADLADVRVTCHQDAPALPADLPVGTAETVSRNLSVLHHVAAADRPLNLLQGPYAPKRELDQWARAARLPAGLAAAWLLLATAVLAVNNHQKAAQLDRLQARAQEQFSQAFPDITRIVDMRVQARQELQRLRGGGGSGGFLPLFSQTAPLLGKVGKLSVDGLQFRDGSLYFNLSGSDLQALERLRAEFQRHQALKLDVQSAQAGTEGVQIRLKVDAV